jgi:hypothetical protein
VAEIESIIVTVPNVKFVGEPSKLLEAIGVASKSFLPVPKNADGQIGQQRFKYTPYHMVMRCVRPALAEQGVTITQPLSTQDGKAISTLMVSGHGAIIMSIFEFSGKYEKTGKDGKVSEDPQEFGKNSTYYRRYQLQSFFGLEGDKDADDTDVEVEVVVPKNVVEKESKQTRIKEAIASRVRTEQVRAPQEASLAETPTSVKADIRSMNERLTDAMKQLKWKMPEIDEFAASIGLQTPATKLPDNQKSVLFDKLVELKGVVPF